MVKIRLSRGGCKNKPFYNIIITDSKNPRDGKYKERVGYYNPFIKKDTYINLNRINYWKSVGGKLTNTVKRIIKNYKKI